MRNILFYSVKLGDWFKPNIFFSKGELAENFNDDLDQRIHTYLIGQGTTETKSFTLPISITGNFYDFSGLILAHHVRLTRDINCCDATIVFYGTLELEQLLRLTPLARILLTANVLYVNIAKYNFDDIHKSIEKYESKIFKLKQFLEEIHISLPSNYDSHHSVDNEFSLIQWSKYIGCYGSIPLQFKKEFDSKLYFKYLKAANPLSSIDSSQISVSTTEKIKILLIDDEALKGWEIFYSSFFKDSEIEFIDSGIDFKNIDKIDIIAQIGEIVKKFNPDVALLDLRLHDSDFGDDVKPDNLTGIQILEKIKGINSGIQVIITTASNKAWNFNLAKQKGAYDFIIKDGFENPEYSLGRLTSSVEISAKRAFILKRIKLKIYNVINLIGKNPFLDYSENDETAGQIVNRDKIRNKFISNLDLAYELLDMSCEDQNKREYFRYTYLQLFLSIEDFINLDSVFEKGDQCFIKLSNGNPVCVSKLNNNYLEQAIRFNKNNNGKYIIEKVFINPKNRFDTNFFVSAILIFKYGNDNSSVKKWTNLYTTRNKAAHEGYTPNETQINDLLDFMTYLFDDNNEINTNAKKGLIPITYEESFQALQQKFKKR